MSEEVVNTEEEVIDPKALLKAHKQAKIDLEKYKSDAIAYKAQLEDATPKTDKYKERAVKAEAKLALQSKGVKNVDRVLKVMDLSGLDFDDDGNLAGLEGKVAAVKEDWPELFSAKHQAGNIDQFKEARIEQKLSPSEIQAMAIRGKI